MPIYQAQTKGKMYIGNSKVKAAYQGNKLVYSSGKEVIAAKSAPPFLSAGWQTLRPNKLSSSDPGWGYGFDSDKEKAYIMEARAMDSVGTKFIGENDIEITISLTVTDLSYLPCDAYLVHSPIFEIKKINGAYFSDYTEIYDDTRPPTASDPVARYSNDGSNWTPWYFYLDNSLDKSYEYAQFGYFFAADASANNIDTAPGWTPNQTFYIKINSFTVF